MPQDQIVNLIGTGESEFLTTPSNVDGPPQIGLHLVGEEAVDQSGVRYDCVQQGSPGLWTPPGVVYQEVQSGVAWYIPVRSELRLKTIYLSGSVTIDGTLLVG